MNIWILIIAMYHGGVDHIEFSSRERCIAAQKHYVSNINNGGKERVMYATCNQK